jgi:hypothetical protein
MKTLKMFIVLTLLPLQFIAAKNRQTHDEDGAFTRVHAIDTYVDAVTRGKLDGFDAVIDPSAKFTVLNAQNKLLSFGKKQMLEFLNRIKNVEEMCTTSTSILQNNTDMVVAKVDMKFEGFTRSNYISIANTRSGWKIINVYSVFN